MASPLHVPVPTPPAGEAPGHAADVPPVEDGDTPTFDLSVDDNGKAKQLKIYSFKRPHMRAFHFAWASFFLTFFAWFALAPMQATIAENMTDTPWLTADNLKAQNIIAVSGTLLMRLFIGPFCDRFGPRIAQTLLLSVFSLPVFLVGTAQSYWQWVTARFFIGFLGAAFVVTQFWTSIMFSGNIVGTANATSAGWGNAGGGFTQVIMPLIRKGMNAAVNDNDKAWRLAMIIPGCSLLLTALALFFLSDDLPQGNYADLHKAGKKEKTNPFVAMARAARNWRVWILFLMYAGCFGVELVMNSNLATYFKSGNESFGLDEAKAGLVASLFGIMNLFARSLGGIFSDVMAKRFGMRGRLWAFFVVQVGNGILFVVFSQITILGASIPVLILFSLFVQMAEGATFGIVPFVDPIATGAVSGIVGAGGNFGAIVGGFFVNPGRKDGISDGFRNLGFVVIASAGLIPFLWWPQYGSMFFPPSKNAKIIEDDAVGDETETETDQTETAPQVHATGQLAAY